MRDRQRETEWERLEERQMLTVGAPGEMSGVCDLEVVRRGRTGGVDKTNLKMPRWLREEIKFDSERTTLT